MNYDDLPEEMKDYEFVSNREAFAYRPTPQEIAETCREIREVGFLDRYGIWHKRWPDCRFGKVSPVIMKIVNVMDTWGEDIERYVRVTEYQRIAPLVQFGKCFCWRRGHVHRVSARLKNSLKRQSGCKITMHQKDSGQVERPP